MTGSRNLSHNGFVRLHGIPLQEERRLHALLLEHLEDRSRARTRSLVKGQRHVLGLLAVRTHAPCLHNCVLRLFHHAAVLGLARGRARPHLGPARNTPRLHVLDGTRALDGNRRLDLGCLHAMLLVNVLAVADLDRLAALQSGVGERGNVHLLLVHMHGAGGTCAFLEHRIINREQVAGPEVEALVIDELLHAGIDAHRGLGAVERDGHAAVGVPQHARRKDQKGAPHRDERVRAPRRFAAIAVPPAVATAETLRMAQVHGTPLVLRAPASARQLLTRIPAERGLFIRGIGGGVFWH